MPEPFVEASDITVRFGGLVALDGVSINAGRGEVVGIIGPNGAGKSTLFGAVLGTVGVASGRVVVDGVDVSRWPAHRRARAGLGRTFQKLEIFGSMTVRENLEFGTEAPTLGAKPWHLLSRGRDRQPAVASDVLAGLGLTDVADRPVSALPVGQRRLVEFGRAMCASPSMLLLDEPSSGLDEAETAQFATKIREAVTERGTGVILVEHDMSLVLSSCERIFVLDFGRVIASGTPAEIRGSDVVREAYLGGGHAA